MQPVCQLPQLVALCDGEWPGVPLNTKDVSYTKRARMNAPSLSTLHIYSPRIHWHRIGDLMFSIGHLQPRFMLGSNKEGWGYLELTLSGEVVGPVL